MTSPGTAGDTSIKVVSWLQFAVAFAVLAAGLIGAYVQVQVNQALLSERITALQHDKDEKERQYETLNGKVDSLTGQLQSLIAVLKEEPSPRRR